MSALQNIRYALRLLRRAPTVSTVAILSTTFSVAATAVVFAAIKAVLIDPLPYARPSELVQIRTEFVNADPSQMHADFAFWNDAQEISKRTHTLQSVGVFGNSLANLAGDSSTPPEALYGLRVSANMFPTLGVTPMLGPEHSSRRGPDRACRSHDPELRSVEATIQCGSGHCGCSS